MKFADIWFLFSILLLLFNMQFALVSLALLIWAGIFVVSIHRIKYKTPTIEIRGGLPKKLGFGRFNTVMTYGWHPNANFTPKTAITIGYVGLAVGSLFSLILLFIAFAYF